MPRSIPPHKLNFLNDKNWLYTKHVIEKVSIVELSKLLKVTPGSVTKYIRKHNITSPTNQELREASNQRKYGVNNPGQVKQFKEKALNTMTEKYGGHIWSNTSNRKMHRNKTCLEKYGHTNPSKNKLVSKKGSETKLKKNYKKLINKDWLYQQHYIENKSITKISSDLGVSWSTVQRYFKDANIEIRSNGIMPFNIEQLLTNKEWLINQHHTLRKPFSVIARELNVQDDTIRKYAKQLKVPILQHSSLSTDVYNKLTNKEWIYQQCVIQMKNPTQIGKELDICSITVNVYCKQYNIKTSAKNRKISNRVLLKLENKDWIYDQHHTQKKPLIQIATELGFCKNTLTNSGIMTKTCRKLNIDVLHFSQSSGEKEVLSFIQSILLNTKIVENTQQIILPYELDIYIPSLNIAIEYCGLYWHSDNFKSRIYHKNKLNMCNKKGIRLLTIFEDEWMNNQEIVKQKIKSVLGIDDRSVVYARKTQTVNIDNRTKKEFLETNHIQGSGPGSITYGLTYHDDIVAVMTFIQRKPQHYELNRYATSLRVVGGFSKLLKHFQRNHQWNEIVSFADLRWSDGNLYEKTGWQLHSVLPVDYYWTKYNKRYHKFKFRHKYLPNKLHTYDSLLSENENCKNNGYLKIYNCGLNRYLLTNPKPPKG